MNTLSEAPRLIEFKSLDIPIQFPSNIAQYLRSPFAEGKDAASLSEQSSVPSDFATCNCFSVRPLADYDGPQTPNIDTLNQAAVALFVDADRGYFKQTRRYLQIESGRRTVYRQAELYTCWRLGQAGCNPADIPGASVHNYGFAIDIRSSGEAAVVDALGSSGWTRTVMPGEPWHWEATSASGYTTAKQRQAEMKAPGSLSRQWQEQWESASTKNNNRNKKIDDFNARLQVWQPAWEQLRVDVEQLQKDIDSYNSRAERWNQDRDTFNSWVDAYNTEFNSLVALRTRIESMPPSPERNALIAEYNRRVAAFNAEGERLQRVKVDLEARAALLAQERQQIESRNFEIQQRYARLNAEKEVLLRLRDEIERLLQEIEKHLADAKKILDQIAAIVHPL